MLNVAIIRAIEEFAPLGLQEDWDNSGLQVGFPTAECTGVLICFDVTPEIVQEAIDLGCNLIISHHPLFFKPVKRLVGATQVQVAAMNAIAAGITIYSSHTPADSTKGGVSYATATKLGITPAKVIEPLAERLVKLTVDVPADKADEVRAALFDAGAGAIADYDCCSFNIAGTSTFRPLEGSNPHVGELGETHVADEVQINMVLPKELIGKAEAAIIATHPYEVPSYQFTPMLNKCLSVGLGVYGTLSESMTPIAFVEHVKSSLGLKAVRCSKLFDPDVEIRRVAVCGGAGGSMIAKAVAMGAQAYITSDIRYHDFVDYKDQIMLIDAGHYETEKIIKKVFFDIITEKFPNFAVHCTKLEDNPINYI